MPPSNRTIETPPNPHTPEPVERTVGPNPDTQRLNQQDVSSKIPASWLVLAAALQRLHPQYKDFSLFLIETECLAA
ncbi:MAG TPA: hypothetical protein VMW38_11030, partial [Terriglobia bacterium]|nr:hypothetical protein [Terriglobia bacterium]